MINEQQKHTEQQHDKPDAQTPGGLPQERVEDRPDVSEVSPEDYPLEQREASE